MKELEPLLVLKTEIENDLCALNRIVERLKTSPQALAAMAPDDPHVPAVAFEIHNHYSVSENLMRRVATAFENALDPREWHKQLLGRMALDIPGVRPALLDPELRDRLDELRKFRHFFRNAYDRPLDAKKVAENLEILLAAHVPWIRSARAFLSWIDQLADRLRRSPLP